MSPPRSLLLPRMRWAAGILPLTVLLCLITGGAAVAQDDPSVVGQWNPLESWGFEAIHMHLLPNGKVLAWGYDADDPAGYFPRIWDPATNTLTFHQYPRDLFCSGHSFMPDGRLLITGGHISNGDGLADTTIFDPGANTFTRVVDMNAGRWYPTNTTLPNGEVLVVSGNIHHIQGVNDLPQVYNPATNTYRDLSSARLEQELYPFMFLAPNGQVFAAGQEPVSRYLNTSGTGAWTVVANNQHGRARVEGTAVLYDNGKVLMVGGDDPPTRTAEVIDLNQSVPAWRFVGSMANPRRHPDATLLPDGKVLVTGGSCAGGFDNFSCVVLPTEMWDPATEQFSTMASIGTYRGYHSTAVLLPDGRVVSAGGDNGASQTRQIFSPPYLFRGPRPTISSAPTAVSYGETFFVGTPEATGISNVNWIRLSSVTHSFNQNQRINRLAFTQGGGGLNVTAPSNPNLCPPGHYMLFILNSSGIPSVARIIRIDSEPAPPDTTPPTVMLTSPADGATVSNTILVSADASDNMGILGIQFQLDGFNLGAEDTSEPYSISWDTTSASEGTHTLTAIARDAANNSTTSSPVTVTVANGPSGGIQQVIWTSLVNVTATGNSLDKTSGCDGCADAGAVSQQQITSGDGYVEFTAAVASKLRYVGLGNGNSDTTTADIDFAIRIYAGTAEVRENNVYKAETIFSSGAVFRVEVESGVVRYFNDGVLFYTSSQAPTYPLLVDTALLSTNATITNVMISTVPPPEDTTDPTVSITSPANGATVSNTITVSADASDNVGVVGLQFRLLDFGNLGAEDTTAPYSVSWDTTTVSDGSHTLTAVARDAANNSTTSSPVNVTVANDSPGGAQGVVWTSLVNVTATGNSLEKTSGCDGCADAGAISQQQISSGDGYVEFTPAVLSTLRYIGLSNGNSGTTPADIDFAIRLYAGTAEVREGNVYKAETTFTSGAVFRVVVASGVVRYYKDGALFYTSARVPTYPLLADTALISLNATVNNVMIYSGSGSGDTVSPTVSISSPADGSTVSGATTVSADASDDVGVVGVQFKLDSSNLGAEDTSAPYSISWDTTTAAEGPHTLTAVARDAATNSTTSSPVSVTVANGAPGGPQQVVWTSLVNVTATGNSLEKTSGCDGCADAGAISQQQISSGDGYVEFTPAVLSRLRYIGLSNGNSGTTAEDIDFAIRLYGGTAEVREGNLYQAETTFSSGAVFRVEVASGVVRYYKNGALFYTSARAPTYPLLVDTALIDLNGTLTEVVISD